jgi:8-oxo-dGTP pyrophosphatase MutT (NUDIX family)
MAVGNPAHPRQTEFVKKADNSQDGAEKMGTQYAALCYRIADRDRTEVLLITSRDTGRWVIPKGWPIVGKSASEGAAQEAFEEAGVIGRVDDHCIGLFSYRKVLGPAQELPCVVAVYPLRVERLVQDFPEVGQRRRKWFAPAKAAAKVDEPELAALLRGFDPAGLRGLARPKG